MIIRGMDFVFRRKDMFGIVLLAFAFLATNSVLGIKILEGTQVVFVRNASETGVIIDCRYQIEGNDTNGMVVKWYFKDRANPVYQWIVGNNSQGAGILKDRLDLSYKVSNDKLLAYRALFIKTPTTELSGKFTCEVSNFLEDKRMETLLIVYTPANHFNISINNDSDDLESIEVECSAEGLYPQPQMKLTKSDLSSSETRINEVNTESIFDSETGTYDINLSRKFKISQLKGSVEFICSLSISNTGYSVKERIIHVASGSDSALLIVDHHMKYMVHLVLLAWLVIFFNK